MTGRMRVRPLAVLAAVAAMCAVLGGCDVMRDTTAAEDARNSEGSGTTERVSGRLQEAEAVSDISRNASHSYVGATWRARERATDVLGRANAVREEQVREEKEFDAPRRD